MAFMWSKVAVVLQALVASAGLIRLMAAMLGRLERMARMALNARDVRRRRLAGGEESRLPVTMDFPSTPDVRREPRRSMRSRTEGKVSPNLRHLLELMARAGAVTEHMGEDDGDAGELVEEGDRAVFAIDLVVAHLRDNFGTMNDPSYTVGLFLSKEQTREVAELVHVSGDALAEFAELLRECLGDPQAFALGMLGLVDNVQAIIDEAKDLSPE